MSANSISLNEYSSIIPRVDKPHKESTRNRNTGENGLQLNSFQVYKYVLSIDYMPRNILDADGTKNCWNLSRMRLRSNAKSDPIQSIRTIWNYVLGALGT